MGLEVRQWGPLSVGGRQCLLWQDVWDSATDLYLDLDAGYMSVFMCSLCKNSLSCTQSIWALVNMTSVKVKKKGKESIVFSCTYNKIQVPHCGFHRCTCSGLCPLPILSHGTSAAPSACLILRCSSLFLPQNLFAMLKPPFCLWVSVLTAFLENAIKNSFLPCPQSFL